MMITTLLFQHLQQRHQCCAISNKACNFSSNQKKTTTTINKNNAFQTRKEISIQPTIISSYSISTEFHQYTAKAISKHVFEFLDQFLIEFTTCYVAILFSCVSIIPLQKRGAFNPSFMSYRALRSSFTETVMIVLTTLFNYQEVRCFTPSRSFAG